MGRGGDKSSDKAASVATRRRLPRAPDTLSADGKVEILIEGRLYDITEFQRKHPGGSVIGFYLVRECVPLRRS